MKRMALVLGLAVVVAASAFGASEDWPKWRGPRGDGISKEALPEKLGEPKKVWTANVGPGYSSPIAVKGTIYVFMGRAPAEGETLGKKDGFEQLIALNAADGKELWKQEYKATRISDGNYKGTRATPVFEEGKVYTMGTGGDVVCWDANDKGKKLWQTNVLAETAAKNLNWGTASSPLLVGDRLYVQAGIDGPVAVGINKNTGKIEWKTETKGVSGYAHPILVDVEGTKQLIVVGGKEIYGIAFDSGKTIWSEKWETSYDVNAATPLYRDGQLFVSSGYGHGSMMLKLSAKGAEKQWESREMASKFPGMILEGEYLYGNSAGKLKCLHWPDGKLVWAEDIKLNEGGSLVKAGDKILAISERGKMFLLKADGTTHEKLGEAQLFDAPDVWSTPLIYDGKVYAKGGSELVCLELN